MAILGLLTDQKMPQSAEKGAQKICFYQKITLQPSKQSKTRAKKNLPFSVIHSKLRLLGPAGPEMSRIKNFL